jgi:hypothetical protein
MVGIPVVTITRAIELKRSKKTDYSRYLEWHGFPFFRVVFGKFIAFAILGLASVLDPAPPAKVLIALPILGIIGFVMETRISLGRPLPTPRFALKVICANCRVSRHQDCTNLRMLDGFEKGFKSAEGGRRPVCCCGFRLGVWEELHV